MEPNTPIFEQYDSVEDSNAVNALKYMLLSKIMLGTPDEVSLYLHIIYIVKHILKLLQ